jgi:hypothetical protein
MNRQDLEAHARDLERQRDELAHQLEAERERSGFLTRRLDLAMQREQLHLEERDDLEFEIHALVSPWLLGVVEPGRQRQTEFPVEQEQQSTG